MVATGLKPFWNYYGGKWRAAPRYPKPRHHVIIEPFAGAAGYSLRYPDHDVVLIDRSPIIASVWRYLISVTEREIRSIPEVEHVDDLPSWCPQEARWLVGFRMNDATVHPCKALSAGKKRLAAGHTDGCTRRFQGWTPATRERVATQVDRIRHWHVIEGEYDSVDGKATWFIDPPYNNKAGSLYPEQPADFAALGAWCQSRRGQVIVCENAGATWLPFEPLYVPHGTMARRPAVEVIWSR